MNRKEMKQSSKSQVKRSFPALILWYLIPATILEIISVFVIDTKYSYLMSFIIFIILTPFALALPVMLLNYVRSGEKVWDIDRVKENIGKIYCLRILEGVLVFLFTLLLVIPGIIKAFAYSQAWFIMADEGISGYSALKRSQEMMKGYKWNFFVFQLSFIWWFLLVVVTLGLAFIWVFPYYMTAKAYYYENLKSIKKDTTTV